jgi:hypothetical protein
MKDTAERLQLMEPVSPEALVPAIGLWPWFVGGAALILLAIAITFLVIALRKHTRDPNAARHAAYQDAIGGLDPDGAADPRDAAIRSSLVLRRYLSVAAADPALFETHEEFVSRHDALAAMKAEVRETTARGFTRLAAMKYGPDSPAADPREIMREARQLLDTLHRGFAA